MSRRTRWSGVSNGLALAALRSYELDSVVLPPSIVFAVPAAAGKSTGRSLPPAMGFEACSVNLLQQLDCATQRVLPCLRHLETCRMQLRICIPTCTVHICTHCAKAIVCGSGGGNQRVLAPICLVNWGMTQWQWSWASSSPQRAENC